MVDLNIYEENEVQNRQQNISFTKLLTQELTKQKWFLWDNVKQQNEKYKRT